MRLNGVAAVLLLSAVAAPAAGGETSFVVKYRSASTVYLEGGRAAGLAAGDRLVVRGASGTTAELEVVFVAEQSASCRVVREARPVAPGDAAVLVTRAAAVVPAPAPPPKLRENAGVPTPPPAARPPSSVVAVRPAPAAPLARFRGGVSVGYYRVQDGSGTLGSEQSSAAADFRAWDIGGLPLSFGARLRSRRESRVDSSSRPGLRDDRVYELSLRYAPPSGAFDIEAGRIGASGWASVGTLDGVLGQVRVAAPFHAGGFYGRRTDLGRPGAPSSALRYGVFVRAAPSTARAGSYEVLLGGVREIEGGQPSREYVSLESRFHAGSRWSLYERAELDVNRGWRLDLTGRPYQLSTLSVSTTVRMGGGHSAVLSYDNRRNHRDHGNRTIPEAAFDDLMRQGLRASLYLGHPRGFNVALNGSGRLGERDGRRGWSYGGALRHGNLFGLALAVGIDGSAFSNGYTDGWLVTAQAGRSFSSGHYLDASYGLSRYRARADGVERRTQWVRSSARFQLVGGLYVLGDLEYGMGDDLSGPRVLVETGYRF